MTRLRLGHRLDNGECGRYRGGPVECVLYEAKTRRSWMSSVHPARKPARGVSIIDYIDFSFLITDHASLLRSPWLRRTSTHHVSVGSAVRGVDAFRVLPASMGLVSMSEVPTTHLQGDPAGTPSAVSWEVHLTAPDPAAAAPRRKACLARSYADKAFAHDVACWEWLRLGEAFL